MCDDLFLATVKAEYSYNGSIDQLTFLAGQEIIVLEAPEELGGWWRGKIGEWKGLFPSTYVKGFTKEPPTGMLFVEPIHNCSYVCVYYILCK